MPNERGRWTDNDHERHAKMEREQDERDIARGTKACSTALPMLLFLWPVLVWRVLTGKGKHQKEERPLAWLFREREHEDVPGWIPDPNAPGGGKGGCSVIVLLVASTLAASLLGAVRPAYAAWPIPVRGGMYAAHGRGSAGVMVLHSLGHDWREPAGAWNGVADANGFVGLYPDTPSHSWNAGLCCGQARDAKEDSVAFLSRVASDARARYHLTRLYVAGTSNGGMMAIRLAAERPWLTGRVATWGAAPELPRPGDWTGRVFYSDGSGDTTVPWSGGWVSWCPCDIRPAQSLGVYLPTARRWGKRYDGYGHSAPSWWPSLAWRMMQS